MLVNASTADVASVNGIVWLHAYSNNQPTFQSQQSDRHIEHRVCDHTGRERDDERAGRVTDRQNNLTMTMLLSTLFSH